MKKFTGNYTAEAGKALKGSERIICRVSDDGTIYVTNGYFAFKMNPLEYAAVIQPVTCCDPGNWEIGSNGKQKSAKSFDLERTFSEAIKATDGAPDLERCPLNLDAGKGLEAVSYYNPAAGFASFYNKKFVAALDPGAKLRALRDISAAVAYIGSEPFALILPIKPEPKAARAVKAYFTEAAEAKTAEAETLRAELAQVQNEAETLRVQITQQAAELEALRSAPQAEPASAKPEPKTAAELIASRWAAVDGLTTTIKGIRTAAPVVWLAGDVQKYVKAIEAEGGKWSSKKSAYYFRVA